MKRFGWVALGWLVACGGQGGEGVIPTSPLPAQPLSPDPSDAGSPTAPTDPTIPSTESPPVDGGSVVPTPEQPVVRLAECQNLVAATLVTKNVEPILDDAAPDAQTFEFTSATDGTVLFAKDNAKKSSLPSYELLGLVLDGGTALISDINFASGSRLYTINAKSGLEHEIAIGELAFALPMLTSDRKAGVFAFTSGRVLAHNFQSQRTTVLANSFPSEFDYFDPPIHQSGDASAFLLKDGSRWVHFDAANGTTTPLPGASEGSFLGTSRRYRYFAGGRVVGKDQSGATVDLGPYNAPSASGCGSISEGGNSLLVVGADGVGRLWRPGDALPATVGAGLCRGVLSANGAAAALTRGPAQGPFSLAMRNLGSGAEKAILSSPAIVEALPAAAGGRVAVKSIETNGSSAGFSTRVRLFDASTGLEIPLNPAVSVDGPVDLSFRDMDRVLATVPAQSGLALYDATFGFQKYRTARSVIADQGQLAIWNPLDNALFTPVDWYLSDIYSKLFAFQLGSNRETAIGDEAIIDCQVGGRAAIRRKMLDPQDTSLPGELILWNASNSSIAIASQAAEQPICTQDRLVYRDRPTAVRNQRIQEGRLWSLDTAAGTKTLVAEGTTSYLVRGNQLIYTTATAVCSATLP